MINEEMMTDKKILEVKNISFAYDDYIVYQGLSFFIKPGEVLCLMGPNGCGKTTVIDTLLGMHRPTKGEVLLCGKSLTSYKRHEIAQKIAYVPQLHSITFPFTVLQVVLMGRMSYTGLFGEPDENDEKIALEALEKVGMLQYAQRPYNLLSGGEIKLVLLARALGQQTPLIILDEPTAHLDFKNELIFLETISDICKNSDIAVIMATHVPDHAFYFESMGLSTYVGLMSRESKGFDKLHKASMVLNEEAIAQTYKVKAKIVSAFDEEREHKTVALFSTIKGAEAKNEKVF